MKLFDAITKRLDEPGPELRLQGLVSSAQPFFLASLFANTRKNLFIITSDSAEAEKFSTDIRFFLGETDTRTSVFYLPPWETLPYEPLSPHSEISATRHMALLGMARHDKTFICVTTASALMQKCPRKETLEKYFFKIQAGQEVNRDELVSFLTETGYIFADPVDEAGTFAVRGGLLDIFPPQFKTPSRIEFFGDEVESIRRFDAESQRSLKREKEILIPPMRETHYRGTDIDRLLEELDKLEKLHSVSLRDIRRKFENREFFTAMELYYPFFHPDAASPMDYVPADAAWITCEPEKISVQMEEFRQRIEEGYRQAVSRGDFLPSPPDFYMDDAELADYLEAYGRIAMAELPTEEESENCMSIKTEEASRLHGAFSRCIYDAKKRIKESASSLIVMRSGQAAKRVEELFAEEDAGVRHIKPEDTARFTKAWFSGVKDEPAIMVTTGELFAGFCTENISIITEEEIFGRHIEPRRKTRGRETVLTTDFSDVKLGDFVVHRDHGIGVYHGARTLCVGQAQEEYLDIEYAENQRLLLPISQIYLLEKYSGAGGASPPLDRMGGKTWRKTRAKIKKDIMKMAKELLDIYAKRKMGGGFAFSPENHFHQEFMESFEFSETRDQATAISDVAKDMESEKPMDRLICGDVGYGKTEVAIRGAFKAALDGKQTALLAPTTLLVDQHYKTFSRRMERFAIRVGMLSRFVSKPRQNEIIRELKQGKLDVIIGTHRLLQKDVGFADLGLLIIDEEHRFGVKHKEKLKKLRETVDALTLSATPIPRTLHMAMSGIRDISIISTPPPARLSITTFIRKFDDHVIREAISRETARGGQVFFLHNSVETIGLMQRRLEKLAPHARIAVAHGQMPPKELEKTMDLFIEHKLDILLCSAIIESGLDIPDANTIIINRADKLGLAQLYQLRGRVGRSRHRAYAYLLVPDTLTPLARKRLKAVEELSELGSGFKLASRDMEIRGAGNMLGSQQSGQVKAVGFETYSRMLSEAVEELRGNERKSKVETRLKLDFVGKLEESYIPALDQRMNFYNRFYRAASNGEILRIAGELEDRYGEPPEKAQKLIDALRIRAAGSILGMEQVELSGEKLSLRFAESAGRMVEVTSAAMEKFRDKTIITGNGELAINLGEIPVIEQPKAVVGFLVNCAGPPRT